MILACRASCCSDIGRLLYAPDVRFPFSRRAETMAKLDAAQGERFGVISVFDQAGGDPVILDAFGFEVGSTATGPEPKMARADAAQCAPVKRARDIICGTLGSLPLAVYDPDREAQSTGSPASLVRQPEAALAPVVTLTRTFEDLLYDGVAWWRIVARGFDGRPTSVERIATNRVNVTDGKVQVDGKHVNDGDLIRFDSPNDALLVAGSRAIKTLIRLDVAAAVYSQSPYPMATLSAADGIDPDDADIDALVTAWRTARQLNGVPYLPSGLEFNAPQIDLDKLQLPQSRQNAVLDIARITGVDPEDLSVSTTSRTYANIDQMRQSRITDTFNPYMLAVEQRLSMDDVTPRGYYVKFNLDSYLRSDAQTRMQVYTAGAPLGLYPPERLAALEDIPLSEIQAPTAAPAPDEGVAAMANVVPLSAVRLAGPDMIEIAPAPMDATFAVDDAKRTITGMLVPYGTVGESGGGKFSFSQGSLTFGDPSRVKLLIDHDPRQAIGFATKLDDRSDGLYGTFKVGPGALGDEALASAAAGVRDGISIGIPQGGTFSTDRAGVRTAQSVRLGEASLVALPAFDDARVSGVAASAAPVTTMEGANVANDQATEQAPAPTFAIDTQPIADAIRAEFQALSNPQGNPVIPAGAPVASVNEPASYNFSTGTNTGAYGFIDDIRAAYFSGDQAARARLDAHMVEAFAVTTANVANLNPNINRQDLYAGSLAYAYPLLSAISTGSISDKTPFNIPQFNTSSGVVGNHTEGVEPTPGSVTTTGMTVTPGAISGKVQITREAFDQGGNPAADGIIWRQMQLGYYEMLEAKVATMLDGLSGLTTVNLVGTDSTLSDQYKQAIIALQFIRGGNRFSALLENQALYTATASARDDNGRDLYPYINGTNANGSASDNYAQLQVAGYRALPIWALGTYSYLVVPESVWLWYSAPKRLDFQYQVATIDIAIWGYAAAGCIRNADVRKLTYAAA